MVQERQCFITINEALQFSDVMSNGYKILLAICNGCMSSKFSYSENPSAVPSEVETDSVYG
jgi:hypothetical protein